MAVQGAWLGEAGQHTPGSNCGISRLLLPPNSRCWRGVLSRKQEAVTERQDDKPDTVGL